MQAALHGSAMQHGTWRHLFIDSKANAQALGFFGLSDKDLPAYVVHDARDGGDDKYISKKALADSLDEFVLGFQVRWRRPAGRLSFDWRAAGRRDVQPARPRPPQPAVPLQSTRLTASRVHRLARCPSTSSPRTPQLRTMGPSRWGAWPGTCAGSTRPGPY